MEYKTVAILVTKTSWFVYYAKNLIKILRKKRITAKLFFDHKSIPRRFEVVFILSYFKIIPKEYLLKHKHNLVIHESDLPEGKGWAPLFWQILEDRKKIPIVLFEASEKIDEGNIYIKDFMSFEGYELHNGIREKQAQKTIELCLQFLDKHRELKAKKQKGKSTFYRKRVPVDSELDINKSIKEQFNLLRIVNNKDFPAFFYYKSQKYIIKIFKG